MVTAGSQTHVLTHTQFLCFYVDCSAPGVHLTTVDYVIHAGLVNLLSHSLTHTLSFRLAPLCVCLWLSLSLLSGRNCVCVFMYGGNVELYMREQRVLANLSQRGLGGAYVSMLNKCVCVSHGNEQERKEETGASPRGPQP